MNKLAVGAVFLFSAAVFGANYGSIMLKKEDVLSVSDGHTFQVDIQQWQAVVGKNVPVRLRGVDTPVIEGHCEEERLLAVDARNFIQKILVNAETIILHDIDRDSGSFRLIADVEVDGVDLGSALFDAKLGRPLDGETESVWCGVEPVTIAYQEGMYTGELSDDLPDGEGTWTNTGGQQYVGQWKAGVWHGDGTYTGPDGSVSTGEYQNGKRNGQNSWTHPDGRKFVGQFRNDQRHGQGMYIFSNGDAYSGEFENGKQHGQGTYTFSDGSAVVGYWQAGKPWQAAYNDESGQEIGQYKGGVLLAN